MKPHGKWKRRLAGLMAVMMFMIAMAPCALADDDEEGPDASFYKIASVASGYFSNALSNIEDKSSGLGIPANSGEAGGFLGYSDEADTSGLISGWIASALSASSASFTYDILNKSADDGSVSGDRSFWVYAQYGRLLRSLGLDSTSAENSMSGIVRGLSGWLMRVAYNIADSVSYLFNAVLKILRVLNPFRFFAPEEGKGLDSAGIGDSADYGYVARDPSDPLYGLGSMLSSLYQTMITWQPWIIGFTCLTMLCTILLTKNSFGEGKQQIKRWIIRTGCIVLAIPICGGMYTEFLNMTQMSLDAGSPADKKVMETFVDFEGWAKRGLNPHMATSGIGGEVPMKITINGTDGTMTIDPQTEMGVRTMAYNINMSVRNTGDATEASRQRATGILEKYANSEFYYSGSYEGYAKSKGYNSNGFTYKNNFEKFVECATNKDNFEEAMNENKLIGGSFSSDWHTIVNVFDVNVCKPNSAVGNIGKQETGRPNTIVYGGAYDSPMSTMSVYNYLTSAFDNTGVTIYSNEKAASGFVRQSHYSVTMVGTGFMSFLYWLDCFVNLIVMGLMGWIFAFSLCLGAIRRFIHLATSLPFAMLGSMKSIARLIIYTIMMFAEILITVFVYQMLCEVIQVLPNMLLKEVGTLMVGSGNSNAADTFQQMGVDLSSAPPASIVMNGEAMAGVAMAVTGIITVVLLMSIFLQVMFLKSALSVRKSVVKFIDEMVTELVEKLLGVKAAPDGGNGGGGRLAAAAAAGAGAGMAQHALAKSGDANSSDSKQEDTKGVSSESEKSEGGGSGKDGSGGKDSLPPSGGGGNDSPALAGENATTIEGSETNISDDDSPVLNQDGDDEQSEMEAANSMESLEDGDTEALEAADAEALANAEAGDDADDGDEGFDGEDGEAALAEAEEGEAAADAEAEAEAADAVEAAEDAAQDEAQDAADDAEDAAQDAADSGMEQADTAEEAAAEAAGAAAAADAGSEAGGQASAGGKPGSGADAKGQQGGKQAAMAAGSKDAAKQGSNAKSGAKSGQEAGSKAVAAVGGKAAGADGKQAAGADDKQAAGEKDAKAIGAASDGKDKQGGGAEGKGNKPALAGGASGSVAEAKSRRDAAAARLAALQAANGTQSGQQGGAALPEGKKGVAVGAAGGKSGEAVPAGGANAGAKAMPAGADGKQAAMPAAGGNKQSMPASAGGKQAVPAGSGGGQQAGLPGGKQAVPMGAAGGAQAMPAGAGGKQVAMPSGNAGGKQAAAAMPAGAAGQPAVAQGGAPSGGKQVVSAVGGNTGAGAKAMPVGAGGSSAAMPAAGGSKQVSVGGGGAPVVPEAAKIPAGAYAPLPGGAHAPVAPAAQARVQAGQVPQAQPAGGQSVVPAVQGAAPVQQQGQAPVVAHGTAIRESTSVAAFHKESRQSSQGMHVKSDGPVKATQKTTTVKFQPAGSPAGGAPAPAVPKQSVAGAAAQAAVAAFLASSDNPVVAAAGQGALGYQQTMRTAQMMDRGRGARGTAMVGEMTTVEQTVEMEGGGELSMGQAESFSSEDSLIANYDAETAEIEAQIAALERAQGMRQSGGGKKLGKQQEVQDDGDFVE